MDLTPQEIKRYGRHLTLPEIGKSGQLKLKSAKILLVGAGGLGSPSAMYLAAAGVGTLGIIDPDKVEFSNLQRQIIHGTGDLEKHKTHSARETLQDINPEVKVITFEQRLQADNALDIMKDYDLVIDGTDNFPARYVINDACVLLKKPFIFGGIFRFEGQCSVFAWADGPCYRCFFAEPPSPGEVPSCAEAGVLGILPGIIGLLQANEAVKLICAIGEPLKGRLLIFDALSTQFREVRIKKNNNCPACGQNPTIKSLTDYPLHCSITPAGDNRPSEISVQQLKSVLDQNASNVYLLDVREPIEREIGYIEGSAFKPFSSFADNYEDIPQDRPVYVYCHIGGRSARVVQFLQTKGYTQLYNVSGGIQAWSEKIDPSIPQY